MSVVNGVTTVEPSTALITIVLARWVVISVPPVITIFPLPPIRVKPPVASVIANASPLFKMPSALASAKTVAPEMYPSSTCPDVCLTFTLFTSCLSWYSAEF